MPSENHDDYEVELEITSPQQDKINQLKELFPELIQDGAVNVGALKDIIGEGNIVGDTTQPNTKYGLYWYGKNKAKEIANKSTRNTLVPQKDLSVNFEETENLLIEGDNLEVLKILQRTHMGKVDVIYIDPPYNTGNDFVYEDDFNNPIHAYLEQTGQLNDEGKKTSTASETAGRKHANWLNMIYPRLKIARGLMKNDGVIFISIDDNELYQLKMICDEIFGEENFINNFMWLHGKGKKDSYSRTLQQYCLCYAKSKSSLNSWSLIKEKEYNFTNPDNDPKGEWFSGSVSFDEKRSNEGHKNFYSIKSPSGVEWKRQWQVGQSEMEELIEKGDIYFGKAPEFNNVPRLKVRAGQSDSVIPQNIIDGVGTTKSANNELMSTLESQTDLSLMYPKATGFISHLIKITDKPNDILVLDFFGGSGTTGQAVMSLNEEDEGLRKFILVQLPEIIKDTKKQPMPVILKDGKIIHTVIEMSAERLRRHGKKVNKSDFGFKSFELSESNYTINRKISATYDPNDPNLDAELLEQWKKELENPLVDGWRAIDVLYENMLREGYSLHSEVKPTNEDGIAYDVVEELSDGTKRMLVCNLDKINDSEVQRMEYLVASGDYNKITFICLDKYLTDTQKYNLGSLLTLKTI